MSKSPLNRLPSQWPNGVAHESETTRNEGQPWTAALEPWVKRFEETMGKHPRATLAAAATVGIFLGWLVKRK